METEPELPSWLPNAAAQRGLIVGIGGSSTCCVCDVVISQPTPTKLQLDRIGGARPAAPDEHMMGGITTLWGMRMGDMEGSTHLCVSFDAPSDANSSCRPWSNLQRVSVCGISQRKGGSRCGLIEQAAQADRARILISYSAADCHWVSGRCWGF